METRRIQLVGGGASYSVSLPKQWVEGRGLHPGDEVLIDYRGDGELSVRSRPGTPAPPQYRELVLRSADSDEILRSFIALYVSGFDVVTVDHAGSDPQAVRTGLGEACARLPGLQVVEEGPNRVVLQDLSDTTEFNLEKGLRRMQSMALQLLGNAGRLVGGGADAVYRESERCEAELDRLILLLLKQYTSGLTRGEFSPAALVSSLQGLHCMFVAQYLERIGDYAMRVSSYAQFLGQEPVAPVTESVRTSLAQLQGIVADAIRAFNSKDSKLANAVIRRSLAFAPTSGRDSLFDVFTAPRSKPQLFSCVRCIKFFALLESVERIALYAKSIAETAINWSMVDVPKAPAK